MAAIDGGTLVLLIVLGLAVLGLGWFGIHMMHTRRRGLPAELELGWHQLPRFWFGINNLIFAALALFVLLLIASPPTLHMMLLILLGVTFLVSLIVVVWTLMASLRLATQLREHARKKREAS